MTSPRTFALLLAIVAIAVAFLTCHHTPARPMAPSPIPGPARGIPADPDES
jgi:hypothetical protein